MRNLTFLIVSVVFVTSVSAQTLTKIENQLVGHLERLEKASNYGGTRDESVQSEENHALRRAILRYGIRNDVLKYSFPKLREKLSMTSSKDGRLRTYSWDTEDGGTMHDFITVYQFRGRSGRAYAWSEPYTGDIEGRGVGTLVHDIFQTQTRSGPIYLIVSTFIGSTSLSGQFISALRINGEKLDRHPKLIRTARGLTDVLSFEYDFFSVVDHPERPIKLVFYDAGNKSFRFPVVLEDSKTPQGRVTDKFITYKFDGKFFVKVR